MLTFEQVAEEAVLTYMKYRDEDIGTMDCRQLMLDRIREMSQHHLIIEEPECCDALPRIEWLHHTSCPEVQAHHAQHESSHEGCPVCAAQKRRPEAEPGAVQR